MMESSLKFEQQSVAYNTQKCLRLTVVIAEWYKRNEKRVQSKDKNW